MVRSITPCPIYPERTHSEPCSCSLFLGGGAWYQHNNIKWTLFPNCQLFSLHRIAEAVLGYGGPLDLQLIRQFLKGHHGMSTALDWYYSGPIIKWRHWRLTSLKRRWFWIRFFFQVYSSKRGYFYNNQNKGASLLLLDLHKSFIMVGTFEREAFT